MSAQIDFLPLGQCQGDIRAKSDCRRALRCNWKYLHESLPPRKGSLIVSIFTPSMIAKPDKIKSTVKIMKGTRARDHGSSRNAAEIRDDPDMK